MKTLKRFIKKNRLDYVVDEVKELGRTFFFAFENKREAQDNKELFYFIKQKYSIDIKPIIWSLKLKGIDNYYAYTVKNIIFDGFGSRFDIFKHGKKFCEIELTVPGEHNVYNALAVFAALDVKGFEPASMTGYFKEFKGMGRRFQQKAEFNGIKVIDDYAHHPEEIKTTLNALSGYKNGRVIAVFQPHRYSRLQRFWNDFLTAFDSADKLVVTDVYNASEEPLDGVNSCNFSKELKHKNFEYISGDISHVAEVLYPELNCGDVVITLGAGTITKLGDELLKISGAAK